MDVVYDYADLKELTIEYEEHTSFKARKLVIGERVGKWPLLPPNLLAQAADGS
ncbi:hypothetical protein PB1_08492 [Bacillus methanolicus PB1]|uniref:Uncharacterized protein n=1 Tax=Bacillus methanolicus PB1 TaxID=997296 RepID=I3E1L3_BACMT|nr:hypothetical protein PB1_08492 [Bacillus methanolicus PB1]